MSVQRFMLLMGLDFGHDFFREPGCSGLQRPKSQYDSMLESHKEISFTLNRALDPLTFHQASPSIGYDIQL